MRSASHGMSVKRSEAMSGPATDPLTASTSTISHVNKPIMEQVMFERRALLGFTAMLGLATIIWIVAISTDNWFHVHGDGGIYMNQTGRYFVHSYSGIWRICRTVLIPPKHHHPHGITNTTISNTTTTNSHDLKDPTVTSAERTFCKYQDMFPSEEKIKMDPALDATILNYSRTEASFAIISLFVMCMGFAFSIYTFRNPRYTFKRLAAGCHGITAVSVLAVIEVLCSSIEYERRHLPFSYPPGASDSYGFSMYLAWIVFLMHITAGIAFLMYSKKRKGSKAPNEELAMVDEPTIIGR